MRNHVFMRYTTLKSSISALAFMSVLTLMTWNVTGIMSSLCYLNDALEKNTVDICGISEHWLQFPQNSYILDCISPNYSVHAVCDSSLNVYNKRNVGKGSVALMWRKHNQIIPLQTDDDRIVGIQLQTTPA